MIEYNGPTSIPDYWISLTGSSRPPRRINTPRHHGRALLKSPHRFGARCGNFSRRRPDPGFVFRTFSHHRAETSSHAREKSLDPRPKAQQSRLNKSNLRWNGRTGRAVLGPRNFNNIPRKQLHVGWTRVRGEEKKITGFRLWLCRWKLYRPTSVLLSDNPENVTVVSFPTRCCMKLAVVYSYSGRCPSPWFRSFLCPPWS